MLDTFLKRYYKKFSDPQIIELFFILIISFLILFFFYDILALLFISLIISYVLEWPIQQLIRLQINRILSILIVLVFFISVSSMIVLIIIPTVWQEGVNLLFDLPSMFNTFNKYVKDLPYKYPILADVGVLDLLTNNLRNYLVNFGESMVRYSVSSFISIITLFVYLILIPLIIFFFLKDKYKIINLIKYILPSNKFLIWKIYKKIKKQMSNYVFGKLIEMVIVGFLSYVVFVILKLHYSLFLSVFVGISVLIPYIGAVIITIPLVLVALFQWGIGSHFWSLTIIYLIIQFFDGNLLGPILFSEVVNLHPLIIILSTFIFGKFFGFWGVFFSIPLIILIKSVIQVLLEENYIKR